MANSSLENKIYKVPMKVTNRIKSMINKITVTDAHAKGISKANEIVKDGQLTYPQMKALKTYFDNYVGKGLDDEYKILGGQLTSKWVDDTLGQDRDSIKTIKNTKKEGGIKNAFLKKHTKDNDNANPTGAKGGMIDVSKSLDSRNIMANTAVYQSSANEEYNKEIDSMRYLIEYMNKQK
jgi:hypothetical protein